MEILDGKVASRAIREDLTKKVASRLAAGYRAPHLAAILVGHDGASETYVASKIKNCRETGFISTLIRFEEDITESELIEAIQQLNQNEDVDGILLQLPLPAHLQADKVLQLIDPDKDVDGFHPVNTGRLVQGLPCFVPATPYGIILLMQHYGIETSGKNAVVIGRSNIVGRPVSILLSQDSPMGNCTVTVCHSRTRGLRDICAQADIIIAALGRPGFLTGDMVKEGAVVIDVGITRIPDSTKKSGFAIRGDVDFASVSDKCSYISPVPGGVGLMTIAALLQNTYQASLRHSEQGLYEQA